MLDTRLCFPEIKLKRSSKSRADKPLYSANLGRMYGRDVQISLYLDSGVPLPEPEEAFLMVYNGDTAPPEPELLKRVEDQVHARHSFVLRMVRTQYMSAQKARYDAQDKQCHSLYLPLKMVKDSGIVYIHVMFSEPFFTDKKA